MSHQCDSCKYNINADYGYSNWTVEGTDKRCAKKVHETFDRFYDHAPEYDKIPNPCPQYSFGEPIKMDVEQEDYSSLTDEQKEIWDNQ